MRMICRCLLFIGILLLASIQTDGSSKGSTEKPSTDESSTDVKIISKERLKSVMYFTRKIELYDHLVHIVVRYIAHFNDDEQLNIKTRFGYKTVPLTENVRKDLTRMGRDLMHLTQVRAASDDRKFPYSDPVAVFRYVRNNTIVLDKVVDNMNTSFNKHGDIEHPAKIHAYNKLRYNKDFFVTEELLTSMKVVLKQQMDSNLSVEDIAQGRLHGNLVHFNGEEATDLGEFASHRNQSYSVLFYEAALPRYDHYDNHYYSPVLTTKSQLLDKMIELYSQYGEVCEYRVEQLQDLKSLVHDNSEITDKTGKGQKNINKTDKKSEDINLGTDKAAKLGTDKSGTNKSANLGTDSNKMGTDKSNTESNPNITQATAQGDTGEKKTVADFDAKKQHEDCVRFIIKESMDTDEISHDEL